LKKYLSSRPNVSIIKFTDAEHKHNRYRPTLGSGITTLCLTVLTTKSLCNLPDAAMLGGAFNRGGATPVGLHGHVIRCSGR